MSQRDKHNRIYTESRNPNGQTQRCNIHQVCVHSQDRKEQTQLNTVNMGGNLIKNPDDVGTPTANLLLIKVFLNSVVSTPGARFENAEFTNFCLMAPLKRSENARIKLADIQEEVIEEYKLTEKATPDGWVYIKVGKGMYRLP